MRTLASILLFLSCAACRSPHGEWKPAPAPLLSQFSAAVDPDDVLPEYPRPQMARERWMSLNGLWEFGADTEATVPRELGNGDMEQEPAGARPALSEQILVPFPMESALSGIGRHIERSIYRRTFRVPRGWFGQNVLLHFGAVDWEAEVIVNGRSLLRHRGGYDPFDVDITDALLSGNAEQELVVRVFDPSDRGEQPRGKQVLEPKGIYYTPSSGIWQTVWIEPVSRVHVENIVVTPDLARKRVAVQVDVAHSDPSVRVEVSALVRGEEVARAGGLAGGDIVLSIAEPRTWSPEDPFLYDLRIDVKQGVTPLDSVASYFGMRTIAVKPDAAGIPRIELNGKAVFQVGVLDQGFWPDGLYTAPTDEALRYDIELAQELGFNMIRKHVKVEPARWYWWCDKLGMLVWQDMPNGDNRTDVGRRAFEDELARMIRALRHHPSIITWVVFNEGWGQYDTPRVTAQAAHLDPTRLVSNASGWTDANCGDVIDIHVYPGPAAPKVESVRAAVLGEFGGLGLGVEGHTWSSENWGYRGVADEEALTEGYVELLRGSWDLAEKAGLCAVVYTQITDVETECNGLATYDRAKLKVDVARVAAANRGSFGAITQLVPDARSAQLQWRHRFDEPADEGWTKPDFDDATWSEGPGGFGTEGTPSAVVHTTWSGSDIWLRRAFTLDALPAGDVRLALHHDEEARIYLNGVLAADVKGYSTTYALTSISKAARAALVAGRNVIAIHCRQTGGGQYIDAGLVSVAH